MAEVKPAEVSAILRQQLSGFKSEQELEEVGTVLQVGDGIARIYGLSKVQSGELIEFASGLKGIVLNLEEGPHELMLKFSSLFIHSTRLEYLTSRHHHENGQQYESIMCHLLLPLKLM